MDIASQKKRETAMVGQRLMDRRKRARVAVIEPVDDEDEDIVPLSTAPSLLPTSHLVPDCSSVSPPKAFLCPLTLSIMFEPVFDGQGNSFEREAILKWLEEHTISPISRRPLDEGMLVPNNALRELIHEYMGKEWAERKKAEAETKGREGHARRRRSASCPYRTKVNNMLKFATSQEYRHLCLKLNEDGSTSFRCQGIVVVLDVPYKVGLFHLYTRDLIRDPTDEMKDRLLELNFLQGETRGGCLSIRRQASDHCEVVFSYNDRVDEVSCRDLRNILLNFVETSLSLRRNLNQKTKVTPSASEDDEKPSSGSRSVWEIGD